MAELRSAEVHRFLTDTLERTGGGGEHLTFSADPNASRMFKATWRDSFGFIPAWGPGERLQLKPALPSEYLLRCGLANVVFGDDIRLEAILPDQAGTSLLPSIITSQPFIVGDPPAAEEIAEHLCGLGFVPRPRADHRRSGLHDVWYRPADQVVICDAVPGNFVRSQQGILAAIDLPASLAAGA